jgi:hypothetical protein
VPFQIGEGEEHKILKGLALKQQDIYWNVISLSSIKALAQPKVYCKYEA